MRAAWILKSEHGIETRVLNVHTVKPLDVAAIVKGAETGVVVTAEEHQVGGFGNQVAAAIGKSKKVYGGHPVIVGMVGVQDRFGESGAPWELVKEFEVSAEHIVAEAKRLYDVKVAKITSGGGTTTKGTRKAVKKKTSKKKPGKKKAAKKKTPKKKPARKAPKKTTKKVAKKKTANKKPGKKKAVRKTPKKATKQKTSKKKPARKASRKKR